MKRIRIPEDFAVSARIMELAQQNEWPDPRKEIDGFRDYHLAHGTVMADWEAAFRTWLRNGKKWGDLRGKNVGNTTSEPKNFGSVRGFLELHKKD